MRYNETLPDHTFFTDSCIDIWQYPGFNILKIFKRPKAIDEKLRTLKVKSFARPHDSWMVFPTGLAWESPGIINTLYCINNLDNQQRLKLFATIQNINFRFLTVEEYTVNYKQVYEQDFPIGVIRCDPEYDYYTVKRLRHLLYWKDSILSTTEVSFLSGIGKKIGAGMAISEEQRKWMIDILKNYGNMEHHFMDGPYKTIERDGKSYKHPF